ncbi:hypothetical protein M9Y10_007358 [Tritrichomonas musculus]|uniref:Protein kinase domain-containing protein n=1 Tax=Tritrichomonas musculus TaxID=1915356 RepID=A0ABR2J140_9EUKA
MINQIHQPDLRPITQNGELGPKETGNSAISTEPQNENQDQSNQLNNDKNFHSKLSALKPDDIFFSLFNFSQNPQKFNSSEIIENIKIIYQNYEPYIGCLPIEQFYDKISSIYQLNSQNGDLSIEDQIKQKIDKIQTEGPSFYLNYLGQEVVRSILDHESLISKYFEKNIINDYIFDSEFKYKGEYLEVQSNFETMDTIFSSKLHLDKNLNIFLEKKYKNDCRGELKSKELRIFESNYSKFIVHEADYDKQNNVMVPYYPLGSLGNIFFEKTVNLTLVDKIVIILEIARALRDLHLNDEFHGNLSSQSVYLDSNKDAYLFIFDYDEESEKDGTRTSGPFYYRPPERYSSDEQNQLNRDNVDFELYDVYSFGVLMHEIATDTSPGLRMENKPRKERNDIINGKYFEFLMKGKNNEIFGNDSILNELKNVIEKCIENDPKNRYKSMNELINSIENLSFYKNNKDEIEYRLEHANDPTKYRCKISDVVKSYYLGQSYAKRVISLILTKYDSEFKEEDFQLDNGLIDSIFRTLEIKYDIEDLSYFFKDIFDYIIQNYERRIENSSLVQNSDDFLYSLSLEANSDKNSLSPLSSLHDFNENHGTISFEQSLNWAYFIAKELSVIHSNNLYHGQLSTETIGIYFNKKTKSFVPAVIPYYSYYKLKKSNGIYNNYVYSSKNCEKMQKKDIKQYLNIIQSFEGLSETILKKIEDANSMNAVIYYLYNYIIKFEDFKRDFIQNQKSYQYEFFHITYQDLIEIFKILKDQEISENVLNKILILQNEIQRFLSNTLSNLNATLKENIIGPRLTITETPTIDLLKERFGDIKSNCMSLYRIISSQIQVNKYESDIIIEKGEKLTIRKIKQERPNIQRNYEAPHFNFRTIPKEKDTLKRNWYFKWVIRRLDISELYFRTFEFFLKRYLLNLNPRLCFKIIIRIINKTYSKYQDVAIKTEDIIYVANCLGYNNIVIEDGNVAIIVPRLI